MWPNERSATGGIDQVPLAGSPGELWLAGKHAVGPNPQAAMAQVGATVVVCLNQIHELSDRYPEYPSWLTRNAPDRAVWFPIPDLSAPSLELVEPLLADLRERLASGQRLLMHCAAGFGRTGTVAACVLIQRGLGVEEALRHIATCRPMAGPEVGAQRDLVARVFEQYASTI
jgi:protein-tyrosine phosphatase